MYIYLFCVVLPNAFMCALLVYANTTDCPFFFFFFLHPTVTDTPRHTTLDFLSKDTNYSSHLTTHPIFELDLDFNLPV